MIPNVETVASGKQNGRISPVQISSFSQKTLPPTVLSRLYHQSCTKRLLIKVPIETQQTLAQCGIIHGPSKDQRSNQASKEREDLIPFFLRPIRRKERSKVGEQRLE